MSGGGGHTRPVRADGVEQRRSQFLPPLESSATTEAHSPAMQQCTTVSPEPLPGFPVNGAGRSDRW
jgi:hypothetical protein